MVQNHLYAISHTTTNTSAISHTTNMQSVTRPICDQSHDQYAISHAPNMRSVTRPHRGQSRAQYAISHATTSAISHTTNMHPVTRPHRGQSHDHIAPHRDHILKTIQQTSLSSSSQSQHHLQCALIIYLAFRYCLLILQTVTIAHQLLLVSPLKYNFSLFTYTTILFLFSPSHYHANHSFILSHSYNSINERYSTLYSIREKSFSLS